jgi:O-antigen/teichoic acid export membrane protein
MRLARNIVWNTTGVVLPILVGIVVVPMTVKGLGTERFGALSIMWMLIGYFSIFDLGLGRTLTKLAADRLAAGREDEVAPLASTTLILVLASSSLMSLVLAMSAGWISQHVLVVSPELRGEVAAALACVAISLPFVLTATVLTGLLEAYQKFPLTNLVRVPFGILMLAAPLLVLQFSKHLGVITAVLAGLRVLNAGVLSTVALRTLPLLRGNVFVFRRELLPSLLAFGGWLTVSNVVGPVMVYFDRFVIAAVIGSAEVAYYTVPYDLLNRVLILPTAVQGVLFPAFATLKIQNSPRLFSVFERSSETTMLLMTVPLVATMLLAYQGLELWVGASFAQHSAAAAKILVVGVVANAMARTPFVFVQGVGYAKWTAILHLFELPLYAAALWLLLKSGAGIEGVAWAWTGRIIVDTVALYVMAVRLEPRLRQTALRDLFWVCGACSVAACLNWGLDNVAVRVVLMLVVGLACGSLLLANLRGVRPAALLKRNT